MKHQRQVERRTTWQMVLPGALRSRCGIPDAISSSLAPANIWTGPAISSSWQFGNASSRMRCGAGIGRLYQSAVVTRRPKTSHFGPRQGPVGNWQGCRSGRDALLVLELYGHVLQHRLPQLLLAA